MFSNTTFVPVKLMKNPRDQKTPPPQRSLEKAPKQANQKGGYHGWWFAFATLLAIYFAICWQGERILKNGLHTFFKDMEECGFGVSYSPPKSSYFAFQSGLYLDDLEIKAPENTGDWTFKAARLSIFLKPWDPKHIFISMNGTHSLVSPRFGDVRLIANRAHAEITRGIPLTVSVKIDTLQATAPVPAAGAGFESMALKVMRRAARNGTHDYSYDLKIQNVRLPDATFARLPEKIDYLAATGTIGDFPDEQNSTPAEWVDRGGLIEITGGELIWKPLMAEFSATVAFDPSFHATVASSAKVYGFFEMLDLMEKEGFVRSGDLSVAKIVLGEKLNIVAGEKIPSLTVPFTFQNGNLYAGRILLIEGGKKTDGGKEPPLSRPSDVSKAPVNAP